MSRKIPISKNKQNSNNNITNATILTNTNTNNNNNNNIGIIIPINSSSNITTDQDLTGTNLELDFDNKIKFLGFTCNASNDCETIVLPETYKTINMCANKCSSINANAASFVNPEVTSCLNCYGNKIGECICYKNAYYTSNNEINDTFANTYQLFRIS